MTTSPQHSTALAATWCRMWNDDPSLAHLVVGDRLTGWFGNTDSGALLTDAGELEAFVARYREQTPNVFTPKIVVADPVTNRMAYTWDVHLATGVTVSGIAGDDISGIDVNTLDAHDRIVVNRTVPMHVLENHDLPEAPSRPLSRATIAARTEEWLASIDARADGELVVDEAQQRSAACYATTVEGREVGGLAVLAFGPDGTSRAWTARGTLPPLGASA